VLSRKPFVDHFRAPSPFPVSLQAWTAMGLCGALSPLLAACGTSVSTATCASTQAVASYTHSREVEAESQHASFGGYLEYGKSRCTAYVEYTASEPVEARLWTAAHCYNPGLAEKPMLALYDRGRFVDVPLGFVETNVARAMDAKFVRAPADVRAAVRAASSGVPDKGYLLNDPKQQCDALVKKATGSKGTKDAVKMQSVCASYHDLVVFKVVFPTSLPKATLGLLQKKAREQLNRSAEETKAASPEARAFLGEWKKAYDLFLRLKRFTSLATLDRGALRSDPAVRAHIDGTLTSFPQTETSLLLTSLATESAATRELVAKKYFGLASYTALESELASATGDDRARLLLRGSDVAAFYAGKGIEALWSRVDLTSDVDAKWDLSALPFLFHSHVSFRKGNPAAAGLEKDPSHLGPYFVRRRAANLSDGGRMAIAEGTVLFRAQRSSKSLVVLPGDSGSLFTLFDLPVAVVSMVDGKPTSGGQVLRPLPKQSADQTPPGEGTAQGTGQNSGESTDASESQCTTTDVGGTGLR